MSYRDLKSYQAATIIYDFTVEFCDRFVKPDGSHQTNRSNRMVDQMVQAARSGKQNIVEAAAERASEKTEIKLTGVARASLEELLNDYEDFLRQRGLPQWDPNSAQAKAVRSLAYRADKSCQSYRSYLFEPTNAANAMVCLINQCNFLLDRQIGALERAFVKDGGWTEKLRQKRLEERKRRIPPLGWNRW